MNLSEHFTLEEFTFSETANKLHIDNTPSDLIISSLKALVQNVLEPARILFGSPITISSGYRCIELNKAVGGKLNSQHLKGQAADLHVKHIGALQELFKIIRANCDFDQLLFEKSSSGKVWVHVSYVDKQSNRHQVIENYCV